MKRVLITGVNGFIGRALAGSCLGRGDLVQGISSSGDRALSGGLAHFERMRLPDAGLLGCLRKWQPDLVFHCAGSAVPALSVADPDWDFRSSVPVMQNLLEGLRRECPSAHVVMLSSAAVYGQPGSLPVAEDAPSRPLSPYGYHKWMGELICREYAEIYGIRTTCARVFSAYGPGLEKQIVWDAIGRFRGGAPGVFHGTGAETRDFIYIEDLVEALQLLASRTEGEAHGIYNVASGSETRIDELVARIANLLGVEPDRWSFSGSTSPGIPQHWRADISRIAKLGYSPRVGLEEGLRRTVEAALVGPPAPSGIPAS